MTIRTINPENGLELSFKACSQKSVNGLTQLDKDSIRELIKPLARIIKGKRVRMAQGSKAGIFRKVLALDDSVAFNRLVKDELIEIYGSFMQDFANIGNIAAADSRIAEAWKRILQSPDIKSDELKEILKREVVVRRPQFWSTQFWCDCLFWPLMLLEHIKLMRREDSDLYVFSIKPKSRAELAGLIMGENAVAPVLAGALPEDRDFIIDNFEDYMPADLGFLSGLAMTGSPLGQNGSVGVAKLKSLKKSFVTADFNPSCVEYQVDRIELLVTVYFTQNLIRKKVSDPGEFACFVAKEASRYISDTRFGAFLPAFKGFTKAWASNSHVVEMTEAVNNLLAPSADGWMSLENLKLRYLCCRTTQWDSSYISLFPRYSRCRATLRRKDDKTSLVYFGDAISRFNFFEEVDFAFVLHWIKFLCAAGIAEIASEKNCDAGDPLEGMRYVRLTPLGRYAFGIDKSYSPKPAKKNCDIEFDERNGIFTVSGGNSPFTMFLHQIANPIGQTRFRISAASLLQGCSDADGLKSRIENLRAIVDVDSSEALKSIIREAIERTECAERVRESFVMLRIKPGNHGLAGLLTSDKEIRGNIILCENNCVLIKQKFYDSFCAICRNNGYII